MISIFKLLVPASVLALFLSETLLIFACYGTAAYLDPELGTAFLWDQGGWQRIALVVTAIVLAMYFRQLYADLQLRSRILLLQQLVLIMGIAFLVEALVAYWDLAWALPRAALIAGSAFTIAALFVWRVLFSLAIRNKVGLRRVLFMGLSPASVELAHYLVRHPEIGFAPIGYLDSGGAAALELTDVVRLGSSAKLQSVVEEYRPDRIVIGKRSDADFSRADDFAELHFGGVTTEDVAGFYEKTLGRVCAAQVRPEALLFSESLQPDRLNLRLQTMYGFLITVLVAPVVLLLTGAMALFVKLTGGGPVLRREQRVGMNGALFTMYSFRVKQDALRDLGMHGLPRFWNVLRGQMSLVGPQADRPEFAAYLNRTIPFHAQRTAVRPGMTGWDQINQLKDNSSGNAVRRLEYDMYYIKNLSFLLDLFVLVRWFRETYLFRSSADR